MGYLKAVILIKTELVLLRPVLYIFTLPKQHLQKWCCNRFLPDCGTTFQILISNFMLRTCTFFSNLAKLGSIIKVPVCLCDKLRHSSMHSSMVEGSELHANEVERRFCKTGWGGPKGKGGFRYVWEYMKSMPSSRKTVTKTGCRTVRWWVKMSKSLRLLCNQLKIICRKTFKKTFLHLFWWKKQKYVVSDGNCAHTLWVWVRCGSLGAVCSPLSVEC